MARHWMFRRAGRASRSTGTLAETCFWWLLSFRHLRPHYIRKIWDETDIKELSGKVAVFVHYDRRGRVHNYIYFYLQALRDAGYHVVVVSNAPSLDQNDIRRLLSLSVRLLWRRNIGYDFGAAKDAIHSIGDLSRFDQLIVCNDSVYGPLFPLAPLLDQIDCGHAQVWGMTDCWINYHHIQSYFMAFTKPALESDAFRQFWRKVRYIPSKRVVVRLYEIGLSEAMRQAGLRCAALMPYSRLTIDLVDAVRQGALDVKGLDPLRRSYISRVFEAVQAGIPLNPTHYFWDHLIVAMGFPFIKSELLARNPGAIVHISLWQELVKNASDYDPDLIISHLETIMRGRAA